MTEAARAITYVGFEWMKANRIEIRCDRKNVRSSRVAEGVGYRLEAEFRNECVGPQGNLRGTLVYALLPDAYENMKEQIGEGVHVVFPESQ